MSDRQLVVLDNTVLVNFALAAAGDLLQRLWHGTTVTTRTVWSEYTVGIQTGRLPGGVWPDLAVVDLTPEEQSTSQGFSPRLGAGERSCLAVAHLRSGSLASDDLDARKTALQLDIPITGTVGLLILGIRRGKLSIDDGNGLLAAMIDHGYHAPILRLDDVR